MYWLLPAEKFGFDIVLSVGLSSSNVIGTLCAGRQSLDGFSKNFILCKETNVI